MSTSQVNLVNQITNVAATDAGAGLPLSQRLRHVNAKADDQRELRLYPLKGKGSCAGLLFEDKEGFNCRLIDLQLAQPHVRGCNHETTRRQAQRV